MDFNGTQAAIRAGYAHDSASVHASRLLANVNVQLVIDILKLQGDQELKVTREAVINEMARVGLLDPRKLFNAHGDLKPVTDLDDDTAAAVKSVEVVANKSGKGDDAIVVDYTHKIQLHDKMNALGKLGEHFNIYKDHQKAGNSDVHIHIDSKDDRA